jgi:DNA polymerase I-like protein with 3'-5' exonuclease and polymerase domains
MSGTNYTLIDMSAELAQVLGACAGAGRAGADVETTGLDPRRCRARLLQLAFPWGVYIIDLFAVEAPALAPLWEALRKLRLVFHNSQFDLQFLARLGFATDRVGDTQILSRLLYGVGRPAGFHSLAGVALRELGVTLGKSEQVSDWSGKLTEDQLHYAALDAATLPPLHDALSAKVEAAGLAAAARIESEALPAVAAIAGNGLPFDWPAWEAVAARAERGLAEAEAVLDRLAPPRPAPAWNWGSPAQARQALALAGLAVGSTDRRALKNLDHPAAAALLAYRETKTPEARAALESVCPPRPAPPWNWASPVQVRQAFSLLGVAVGSTDDEALAGLHLHETPAVAGLAGALRTVRGLTKQVSTYGRGWEKYPTGGRVYTTWKQIGAETGRMASGAEDSDWLCPNLQNLPGKKSPNGAHRKCFRAPEGRGLVKADYSQIELRIAARISQDRALLDAYARGEDVHTLTARRMLGKDDVSKAERDLAKPVNFGLVYGQSATALRRNALKNYNLNLSEEQAVAFREAFFGAYPGVTAWHEALRLRVWRMQRGLEPAEARTLDGRRMLVKGNVWHGKLANYAVQGTGGDLIKRALGLLWQRRGECPGALLVAVVHDEVVVECASGDVGAAGAWVRRAMLDAGAAVLGEVPCEVEVAYGPSWGEAGQKL